MIQCPAFEDKSEKSLELPSSYYRDITIDRLTDKPQYMRPSLCVGPEVCAQIRQIQTYHFRESLKMKKMSWLKKSDSDITDSYHK